jgi:hypothetical protein
MFSTDHFKDKEIDFILYPSRLASSLVSLPIDIVRERREQKKLKEVEQRDVPSYLFTSDTMNILNYVAYKSTRYQNNFKKEWVWMKDNEKIIRDFIKIISRHRICEGFELVHTCNDDLLFIKQVKLEKHHGSLEENVVPSLIQYLIKYDKKNKNLVHTKLFLDRENGHYSIHNKKFSKRKKKKSKCISYNQNDFFKQLSGYFMSIDKFLFTNICTYHNLLMNALDRRVKNVSYSFLSKSRAYRSGLMVVTNAAPAGQYGIQRKKISFVTYGAELALLSELCYFKGLLNDQYSSIARTHQDELLIRLKILILFEDMKKYMINSYPALSLPYNKEKEREVNQEDLHRSIHHQEFEVNPEENEKEVNTDNTEFWLPTEYISGEDIDFSIDLLLDNSEKLGEHKFDVPDMPHSMIKNNEFRDSYYSNFYKKMLTVFEKFSDYQISSQKYRVEDMLFVKLISKDQLFIIKINTFEVFYKKSFQYIKKGTNVFMKANFYQINNVMIGLSFNETESILHDLNPNYNSTHEWTREYFEVEENVHVDYSEFGLDDYFEEDDEEWITMEKSIDSIIKNFIIYINS